MQTSFGHSAGQQTYVVARSGFLSKQVLLLVNEVVKKSCINVLHPLLFLFIHFCWSSSS